MTFVLTPRSWRQSRKLTLAAVAEIAGIAGKNPSRTYQRWELGRADPPLEVISLLETASDGLLTLESWRAARRDYLNVPSTPSSDSTAGHNPGSSTHPIRESGVEPRPIPAGAESQSSVDGPDHIASSNLQNEERATARRQVS